MAFTGPFSQINQFTAFTAERAVFIVGRPFETFLAGGALNFHKVLTIGSCLQVLVVQCI